MENIIQIAGIRSIEEARLLLESGVDYIGFPLRLAYHRPELTEVEAAEIITNLACGDKSVLITYLDNAQEIASLSRLLKIKYLQLHGFILPSEVQKLRRLNPDLSIIKSLIVRSGNMDELRYTIDQFADLVDAFITDTFDPTTGATGATGKTHDWEISRRLVEYSPKPIILAGGLNPDNVAEAILTVKPAGVDAHTGLEDSRGNKDIHLVSRFVQAARQAFSGITPNEANFTELPIDGVLDLHTFSPKEIKDLIPEYLETCRASKILDVRIIHGKGTGALRETVHAILRKLPYVEGFQLADELGGGWGATIVRLKGKE